MTEELKLTDPKAWKELKKYFEPRCDFDLMVELAYKCAFFGGAVETKEVDGKIVHTYISPENLHEMQS